jgi:phospholipid/cholesterol/gamma-HCH transport system ATP-binding protein
LTPDPHTVEPQTVEPLPSPPAATAAQSLTPKLHLKDVTKTFGARRVLDGVDIAVAPGRSLVIIGASGQGKSVTLKIAVGLMRPDEGQVLVDGEDVTGMDASDRARRSPRFGMLFQGAALFDSLRVWENVAFRLVIADKVPKREAKDRAIEALGRVGLSPEFAGLYPGELSGGMQKRVGLARAVVAHPDILFFDEPTTGLDPINSDVINNLILEEVKRLGCTAISITHDMTSARKIGDEIAMLHGGHIVWRGDAKTIDESDNAYVRQFINGVAQGPITGDVVAVRANAPRPRVDAG